MTEIHHAYGEKVAVDAALQFRVVAVEQRLQNGERLAYARPDLGCRFLEVFGERLEALSHAVRNCAAGALQGRAGREVLRTAAALVDALLAADRLG
jgi:hypothetical protein